MPTSGGSEVYLFSPRILVSDLPIVVLDQACLCYGMYHRDRAVYRCASEKRVRYHSTASVL
jgi:hypothetical protein